MHISYKSVWVFFTFKPSKPVTEEIENIQIKYVEYVKITVLVDNNPYNNLKSSWGISIIVETPNHTILFDTGPNPNDLEYNCEKLHINMSKIDIVVISHEHGDHVGGLTFVARKARNATVFIPLGMSENVKKWIRNMGFKRVVEVKNTSIISKGIVVVGELYGPSYEQALAIKVKNRGLIVFVGCSHPGVDRIVDKIVKESGEKPFIVIGGFHMASASKDRMINVIQNLMKEDIKYIALIHCSGENFRNKMDKNYHPILFKATCRFKDFNNVYEYKY